jgi:16S rRNA (guanine966-N2)-methyltransferase
VRIVAGQHRGLKLAEVGSGDPAAHLRPTSDRVRETLFNVLRNHGQPGPDTRVLDLFAGTGALAIEALSRGAVHATLVDNGRAAQALIRENLRRARRDKDATLLATVADRLPAATHPCDLVFLDPPYGQNLGLAALLAATAGGWIAPDAVIVWEEAAPQIAPAGFTLLDQRRIGATWITLLTADHSRKAKLPIM